VKKTSKTKKEIEEKRDGKKPDRLDLLKRLNPVPRVRRKKAVQPELIKQEKPKEVMERKRMGFLSWLWRIVLFVVVIIVVIALIFGIGIYVYGWKDKTTQMVKSFMPYPAAIVNILQIIKLNDFDKEVEFIKKLYSTEVSESQRINFSTPDGEKKLKEFKQKILDSLIENQVIESLAAKYKQTASSVEIDDLYKQYEQIYGKEKLAEIPDVRNKVKVQVLRKKLEDKVIVQIRARQILVSTQAKADAILKQLKEGASFEELARKESEDKNSKDAGGDLGFFSRGQMVKEFEDAAFALKVGEISGIVKTRYGFHLIKVEERKGQIDKEINAWIQEEIKKAIVWRFVSIK
jgi:hypothetical protein